jgi:hypothetical protein
LNGKVHEKDRRQQILAQLARLESVERRWLGSVLASMILSAFILLLLIDHLEMGHVVSNQPAQIPAIQFLLVLVASMLILIMNLAAFVDYFAFEVHVERQVVITKKRRRRPLGEEDDEEQ